MRKVNRRIDRPSGIITLVLFYIIFKGWTLKWRPKTGSENYHVKKRRAPLLILLHFRALYLQYTALTIVKSVIQRRTCEYSSLHLLTFLSSSAPSQIQSMMGPI